MNGGGDPIESNQPDDILQALSHHARRDVIDGLMSHPRETMTLDELAEEVMARRDVEADNEKHEVEILLHHVHVPKLAEHGIVEFDPRGGRVRYRGDAELETLLDTVRELEGE